MQHSSESTHRIVEHDTCPQCGVAGWMTAEGRFTALCGTFWDDLDGVTFTAPACSAIEHRNDLIEERDARIRELELARSGAEVAA